MSLVNVRQYFKDRLDGLGFREWPDGFAFDNIPETIIDHSYHVFLPSMGGFPINQTSQDVDSSVVVRIFLKGYRDASEAIEESIEQVECVLNDVLKVGNRTATLLNVVFDSADFAPIKEDNETGVLVEMNFTARVILDVEKN